VVIVLILDVELTTCIVARLFSYQGRTRGSGNINTDESGRPNAGVIWLESAALSGGFGLVFLITYLVGSPVSEFFFVVLGQIKVRAVPFLA